MCNSSSFLVVGVILHTFLSYYFCIDACIESVRCAYIEYGNNKHHLLKFNISFIGFM